jgi:hypothetical protein
LVESRKTYSVGIYKAIEALNLNHIKNMIDSNVFLTKEI